MPKSIKNYYFRDHFCFNKNNEKSTQKDTTKDKSNISYYLGPFFPIKQLPKKVPKRYPRKNKTGRWLGILSNFFFAIFQWKNKVYDFFLAPKKWQETIINYYFLEPKLLQTIISGTMFQSKNYQKWPQKDTPKKSRKKKP